MVINSFPQGALLEIPDDNDSVANRDVSRIIGADGFVSATAANMMEDLDELDGSTAANMMEDLDVESRDDMEDEAVWSRIPFLPRRSHFSLRAG